MYNVLINEYWSLRYETGKDSQNFLSYATRNSRVTPFFFLFLLNFKMLVSVLPFEMDAALYTNLHVK